MRRDIANWEMMPAMLRLLQIHWRLYKIHLSAAALGMYLYEYTPTISIFPFSLHAQLYITVCTLYLDVHKCYVYPANLLKV